MRRDSPTDETMQIFLVIYVNTMEETRQSLRCDYALIALFLVQSVCEHNVVLMRRGNPTDETMQIFLVISFYYVNTMEETRQSLRCDYALIALFLVCEHNVVLMRRGNPTDETMQILLLFHCWNTNTTIPQIRVYSCFLHQIDSSMLL